VIVHEHANQVLFKIVCVFALFFAYKFCIHGERKMWAPCLEDELTSCVVLVFVLHDVLRDQGSNWWIGLQKDD
jgi:hypothetical protein